MSFRTFRTLALLALLFAVGLASARQSYTSRSWNTPLEVVIYPIQGDRLVDTERYVRELEAADFSIIQRWGEREAARHQLPLQTPFQVRLGPVVEELPPWHPEQAHPHQMMWWSLKFRYWAWRNTPPQDRQGTRVRIFVVYEQGNEDEPLHHSLGLQKGLLGLVHAFAQNEQTQQNNIVIAHELLHTVGATDKYGPNGRPLDPIGLAEPERRPPFPQSHAEIMAGRALTPDGRDYMPDSLSRVLVNSFTAAEINWLAPPSP